MRLTFAPVLVFLSVSASAANLPEFDIKALCGAEQTEDDSSSKLAVQECADNERVARDQLQRLLDTLSEDNVRQCAESVSETSPGSYLALLGCIDSEQSNNAAGEAAPGNRPQSQPGSAGQKSSVPKEAGAAAPNTQTDISPRTASAEPPSAPAAPSAFHFSHDLGLHSVDPDVKQLQMFLNTHGFPVAAEGPGSPGHEVEKYGASTKAALEKFQEAHAKELGITAATGHFGAATRKYINGL
jgi:hypothetical protein